MRAGERAQKTTASWRQIVYILKEEYIRGSGASWECLTAAEWPLARVAADRGVGWQQS